MDIVGFDIKEKSDAFEGFHEVYHTQEGNYIARIGAALYLIDSTGRLRTEGGHNLVKIGEDIFTGYGSDLHKSRGIKVPHDKRVISLIAGFIDKPRESWIKTREIEEFIVGLYRKCIELNGCEVDEDTKQFYYDVANDIYESGYGEMMLTKRLMNRDIGEYAQLAINGLFEMRDDGLYAKMSSN